MCSRTAAPLEGVALLAMRRLERMVKRRGLVGCWIVVDDASGVLMMG